MEKVKQSLAIFFLAIICVSCSDTIFLEEDGVYMPIKVKGNHNSETLIIIVHGGPGSGSIMYYAKDDNFKAVEEKYMVAYYDQRFAGVSQGNASIESLTLETYAQDLNKIILLLKHLHKPKNIIIASHSFGTMVALQYLTTYEIIDEIKGYINISGLHNTPLAYSDAINKVCSYAREQINNGTDSKYWNEALDYYKTIDSTRLLRYSKHYEYLIKSKGVHYEKPIVYVTFGNLFFSEANGFDNLFNSEKSLSGVGDDILQADFSALLPSINLPILVLWGRYDGVIPISSAFDFYEKIGSNSSDKKLVILEKSAHEPFIEQSVEFGSALIDFIEQL